MHLLRMTFACTDTTHWLFQTWNLLHPVKNAFVFGLYYVSALVDFWVWQRIVWEMPIPMGTVLMWWTIRTRFTKDLHVRALCSHKQIWNWTMHLGSRLLSNCCTAHYVDCCRNIFKHAQCDLSNLKSCHDWFCLFNATSESGIAGANRISVHDHGKEVQAK